ncbi:MAG TPA: hypothetical protein VKU89_08940 [Solirubrobacteraceae bacterium]|nr:hypothetical protein [Solirubrobacteraceae bacterium]
MRSMLQHSSAPQVHRAPGRSLHVKGAEPHRRRRLLATVLVAAIALTVALAAIFASSAHAAVPAAVNIVGPGHYARIQEAVNASSPGGWVLIEPGVYDESVRVTTPDLHIRGMSRNAVIIDGQGLSVPGGRNGIEVYKADDVWIENLTVRNFERESQNGANGNAIWWNGGSGSGQIGARGWWGRYLTAYDTGLDGGYGIFTSNETEGSFEDVYASGFNDSGIYVGACRDCYARIANAIVEDNAVGYSGSNAGGHLIIERSLFRHNSAGIVPNSENPGDPPPPQDGACSSGENSSPTPTFSTTRIARCTIIRYNAVVENNNLSTPANDSTLKAPWGVGVELPGTYADLITRNLIAGNASDGVLGFEYPNPFPPTAETIFFQLAGNRISENLFFGNGTGGEPFSGDVTLAGGLFGQQLSTNNCVSYNLMPDPTFPEAIEGTWGCQNETTPNPSPGNLEPVGYLLALQEASESRRSVPQPPPPPQPTMPDPCAGVPANPLCRR